MPHYQIFRKLRRDTHRRLCLNCTQHLVKNIELQRVNPARKLDSELFRFWHDTNAVGNGQEPVLTQEFEQFVGRVSVVGDSGIELWCTKFECNIKYGPGFTKHSLKENSTTSKLLPFLLCQPHIFHVVTIDVPVPRIHYPNRFEKPPV